MACAQKRAKFGLMKMVEWPCAIHALLGGTRQDARSTHGVQFRASFLKAMPPTTTEGIEKYLGSGMIRGIGPVYAKKLVRAIGSEEPTNAFGPRASRPCPANLRRFRLSCFRRLFTLFDVSSRDRRLLDRQSDRGSAGERGRAGSRRNRETRRTDDKRNRRRFVWARPACSRAESPDSRSIFA